MENTTLTHWVEAEKRRLDRFASWWFAEQQNQPELYPPAMPDGEWDEQYRGWGDGECD